MTDRKKLEEVSREVAELIASAMPPGVGFALLVFDFGEGGNLAWMSNAERPSMIAAVREWLDKAGN